MILKNEKNIKINKKCFKDILVLQCNEFHLTLILSLTTFTKGLNTFLKNLLVYKLDQFPHKKKTEVGVKTMPDIHVHHTIIAPIK